MAIVTQFGFTNKTVSSTKAISTYNMGETENYGMIQSEQNQEVTLSNNTTPLDQPELLNYFCRPLQTVQTNIKNMHPSAVKAGVAYGVRLETLLRSTDSADPTFVVDYPCAVTITVKHPVVGVMTSALAAELISRAASSLIKESGEWRLNDLMRSTIKPTED